MNTFKLNQISRELINLQESSDYSLFQFKSLISSHQYHRLYQLVLKTLPAGSAVLDWGCGNGHFSYFLVKQGYRTSGFSFSDFTLRHTLKGLDYAFKQGSVEQPKILPYKDAEFDAVVSVGVLEHVRETGGNEISSLQEIARILKPGGCFICYHLPNQYSLVERIASFVPKVYHHQYRYTRQSIQSLCQQVPLEVVQVQRYGVLPRNFWGKLPKTLRNSSTIAFFWNLCDRLLMLLFSPICQNYLFVAKKA